MADAFDSEELLAVAHIVKPHGVRGEISAAPAAPAVVGADELIVGRTLTLRHADGSTEPTQGVSVRPHNDRWLIVLEGCNDMDAAKALRGVDICLRRRDLPELPEGWFWEADLQRCTVHDARRGELGRVDRLDSNAYQPQLIVIRPNGRTTAIPWVRAFVRKVDLSARRIAVDLPDGFTGVSDELAIL